MNDDVIYEFSGHRLDLARRQLTHAAREHAIALEHGVEERAIILMWLGSEPHWDRLRTHPRFPALLARVGLED